MRFSTERVEIFEPDLDGGGPRSYLIDVVHKSKPEWAFRVGEGRERPALF
jgi:hypothetical protein